MRRALVAGSALVWIIVLLWAAGVRLAGLLGAVPVRWQGDTKVAEALSGDAPYHRFLLEIAGAIPRTARLLLLVHDPGRQDVFRGYRALYELYPVPHVYLAMPAPPPSAASLSLPVEAGLLDMVRREGITHAAFYDATRESAGRVYRVLPAGTAALRLERVIAESIPVGQRAGEFAPRRPWAWIAGWLGIMALGALILDATGLRAVLAGRFAALAASAWLLGAGVTMFWMLVISLAGLRWSLPVALAPIGPAVLAGLWRRRRRPTEPGAPPPVELPPADPGQPLVRRIGFVLVGVAFSTAVLGSLVPMSAWANWDAWAIWALKLRAFWTAQTFPVPFHGDLKYDFSHPDYPPGMTMLHAAFGLWTGGVGESTMRLASPWFLLALALLVAELGGEFGLREERWILAGGCALVPRLLEQGYNGYSDLPLATATTFALWWLVLVCRGKAPAWSVGLACGIAALIKNEGLILCAGCLLVLAVRWLRGRMTPGALAGAALMMVVLAAPWRIAVHHWSLKSTFDVQPGRIVEQLPRYATFLIKAPLLEAFGPALTGDHLRGAGRRDPAYWAENQRASWGGFWWFAAVVLGCYGWSAVRRDPAWAFLPLFALQLGSSWLVTLGAQYEVAWVLLTSVDRMLLQGSPFVFALLAASPGAGRQPAAPPAPPPSRTAVVRRKTQ